MTWSILAWQTIEYYTGSTIIINLISQWHDDSEHEFPDPWQLSSRFNPLSRNDRESGYKVEIYMAGNFVI